MQFKRFKYSLAGAQRLESYRLDELTLELTQLKKELQEKIDEYSGLDQAIIATQATLVELMMKQPLFWMERREAMLMQVSDQRVRQKELSVEMDALHLRMTTLMESMGEARKAQRIFEKHSDGRRAEFDKQQEKAWEAWVDEIWLSRTKEQQ